MMTDGCWVQFWDDTKCEGATIRINAEGSLLQVPDLDKYEQSDGSKEGDEPDSLKTGSRSWLIVYKDKNYGGKSASFGPNSKVDNLDSYGMKGNISSFELYDYEPKNFEDEGVGVPAAIEQDDSINSQTVNNFFRTVVAAAVGLVPGVGSALTTLVKGLWPDVNNRDQLWASYQNYLNQIIAGACWQKTYESLNNALGSLYGAAFDFINTSLDDRELRIYNFKTLLYQVNAWESFFIDKTNPEYKLSFLVPFATLRLATLQEKMKNYAYYFGAEPSDDGRKQMLEEIQSSISDYQGYLEAARANILEARNEMIELRSDDVLDKYNGHTEMTLGGLDIRRTYAETILNALALELAIHNAVGQLWVYFDPDVSIPDPVQLPTIRYATGPFSQYRTKENGFEDFCQVTEEGRITQVHFWSRPDMIASFEFYMDGVPQGAVGGKGDEYVALGLAQDERIDRANGFIDSSGQQAFIKALGFTTDKGNTIQGCAYGATDRSHTYIDVKPLEGSVNTRLMGMSGEDRKDDNLRVLTFHWDCDLTIDLPEEAAGKRG